MISLKRSADEKQPKEGVAMGVDEQYPYGMCLHLDDDVMEKLGIESLPVGGTVMLQAKTMVTAGSVHQEAGEEKKYSYSLQITDIALDAEESLDAKAARMYEDK